jgi:large subunit ribosomal protein L4e
MFICYWRKSGMRAILYDSSGNKKSELELPAIFSSSIREDIAQKYFEVEKTRQPYAPYKEAGKRHAASGKISHRRHEWKGHYGMGISRVPRKVMWRRGTQFFWIAAEVANVRGGRRAHPPKLSRSEKKLNAREVSLAMSSALAATANKNFVERRYSSIGKVETAPFVIESLPNKTSELISSLKNIFGSSFHLVLKHASVRSGKGKTRGRKYKSNAGLLILVSPDEKPRFSGLDIVPMNQVVISDLFPLGRLTLFTKKALDELSAEKAAKETSDFAKVSKSTKMSEVARAK